MEPCTLAEVAGDACRARSYRRWRNRPADLCRSRGQERPVSAARLAAGRNGRPHTRLGADSRRNHGGRGRLSGRARLSADAGGHSARRQPTTALTVVTWVGAFTAVFAALIAVAQNDIKRILAYSTVSQLGYMMAGLGMGGVAVGMFHLITHAFFKALLFMGAGSVIHGCHEEQDIRKMGGLKSDMPLTFLTYGIGMLALCGFPLLFSGFWSKDGILEAAKHWSVAQTPFLHAGLRRAADSVLHDAASGLRLLWPLARPQTGARKPQRDDHATGDSGLLCHGVGIDWNARMAVVQSFFGWPRGGVCLERLPGTRLVAVDGNLDGCSVYRNYFCMEAIRRSHSAPARPGCARAN